jgi:hypothetical protein
VGGPIGFQQSKTGQGPTFGAECVAGAHEICRPKPNVCHPEPQARDLLLKDLKLFSRTGSGSLQKKRRRSEPDSVLAVLEIIQADTKPIPTPALPLKGRVKNVGAVKLSS